MTPEITLALPKSIASTVIANEDTLWAPESPEALATVLKHCQHQPDDVPRESVPVSLKYWQQVHHYWPADHTVSVASGITLGQLNTMLAKHNQWLPCLAPNNTQLHTLLATDLPPLAAGLTHTLAGRFPHQWLLGVDTLYASGTTATSGGRVMKNVSGFDMAKLFTGSMGAYGVITQANLRLESHPDTLGAALLPVDNIAEGTALAAQLQAYYPAEHWLACELVPSALTQPYTGFGLSLPWQLLVLWGGEKRAITQQLASLAQHTPQVLSLVPEQWQPLVNTIADPRLLAVITGLPNQTTDLANTVATHLHTTDSDLLCHSRPAAGMVFIRGEFPNSAGTLPSHWHQWWQSLLAKLPPQCSLRITQPHPCTQWQTLTEACNLPNDPALLGLCAQLKQQFDPSHRFLSSLYPITGHSNQPIPFSRFLPA